MNETTRDPLNRVRCALDPRGEGLVVFTSLEPGGGLPEHWHPRHAERWSREKLTFGWATRGA